MTPHLRRLAVPSRLLVLCLTALLPACGGEEAQDGGPARTAASESRAAVAVAAGPVRLAPYWGVHPRGASCMITPRPDGDPRIAAECARGSELGRAFSASRLCTAAETAEEVRAIHALSCSDAETFTKFLNRNFAFAEHEDAGVLSVTPAIRPVDIAAACKADPSLAGGALRAACAFEEVRCRDGVCSEATRVLSKPEIGALVPALNHVYAASAPRP